MLVSLLLISAFVLLILLRVPVAIALALPPMVYILFFGRSIVVAMIRVTETLGTFTILAIPLFIYVGSLMNESGVTDEIMEFANDLVGHFRGGLAQVNVIASLVFSGMSGSALADIGGLGKILINSMDEEGYDTSYSAALTSASATIGPIFPPSIPILIYAVLAEESALSLLLAGILPALLLTAGLMMMTFYLGLRNEFPVQERSSWRRRVRSFLRALPAIFAPVILIGGMMSGLYSPTESAAVTVIYVILINVLFYRNFEVGYILRAGRETIQLTANILFILAGASLFGWALTIEQAAQDLSNILFSVSSDPLILLIVISIILLISGLILEPMAVMIMTIPLFVPPLSRLGVDPVHFGVVMVYVLMVGLITPPFGLSLYISSDISGEPHDEIVKQLKPYYIVFIVILLALILFPSISLYIPETM
jgi:tripartite ATP-independent transporter DctM subunit